jgi:hypothetical protein
MQKTGLTIRSSRDRFAATPPQGTVWRRRGRKTVRLNSGVRFSAELFWAVLALH